VYSLFEVLLQRSSIYICLPWHYKDT